MPKRSKSRISTKKYKKRIEIYHKKTRKFRNKYGGKIVAVGFNDLLPNTTYYIKPNPKKTMVIYHEYSTEKLILNGLKITGMFLHYSPDHRAYGSFKIIDVHIPEHFSERMKDDLRQKYLVNSTSEIDSRHFNFYLDNDPIHSYTMSRKRSPSMSPPSMSRKRSPSMSPP